MTTVGTHNESTRLIWLEQVLKNLPAGLRLLDAGAGERQFEKFCSHLNYVAQDFAAYNGQGDGTGLQTGSWDQTRLDIISDITAIPEPDASFDVILCVEVFEHLPDPLAALREFSRLLKSGGQLIITAPFCSLTHFAPYHFYSGFNRYFYETHLPVQGFQIVELVENGNFFEYIAQEVRRIPFMIERYTNDSLRNRDSAALDSVLDILERVVTKDQGSEELLCFGYHISALKKAGQLVSPPTETASVRSPYPKAKELPSQYSLPARNDQQLASRLVNIIAFSKDRPCQLELFLRSVKIFFRGWQSFQFSVLYTYSEPFYLDGYEKLKGIHPEFNYVCEKEHPIPFKQNVLNLLHDTSPYTLFFVDDNVFREPFDLHSEAFQVFQDHSNILSLSLRLSPEITYSYSTNSPATPPNFESNLIWNWQELTERNDWNYPMSLDGHIFRTKEIKPLIESAEFYNPNLLEEKLAISPINLPKMICYPHSKITNIPANRVQSTHVNRHGNLMAPAEFNREFLNGKIILLKNILDAQPIAVHQEIDLQLGSIAELGIEELSSAPKFSVIIACGDRGKALPQMIESLWAQTDQDFEILIADRDSTDDTMLVATSLMTAYPSARLQYVRQGECATSIAKGTYKLFLDVEQVICSTMLSDYLNFAAATSEENLEGLLRSVFYPWQKVRGELERSQCQLKSNLQQTQAGLERSMQQSQQAQIQIQKLWVELQQTATQQEQTTIRLTNQLERTRGSLIHARAAIASMESSKFWKLRNRWFDFRKSIGITSEDQSVTPKAILQFALTKFQKPRIQTVTISQDKWPENKPLVSVIIPCFNYGRYLEEAIDSVLAQTCQDFEIIVVDDGSDDALTRKVLEGLTKPKTQVIRQSNQKLPSARNNGIELARGKYICCLDADDLLKPTYLEKCLIALETENLDICYSWVQEFGDRHAIGKPGNFDLATLIEHNCVAVAAVFKREAWERAGGYDPKMVDGYEDWNFWIAIAKNGVIGAQINEPLFLYRKHGNSMIDVAIEKHEALYKQIQANHKELFSDRKLVQKINRRRQNYTVENGYANLTRIFPQLRAGKMPQNHGRNGKILFALPWLVMGGADTVMLQLIETLNSHGFQSTVCTTVKPSADMGDSTSQYERLTREIYHLPSSLKPEKWKEFLFYVIESRKIDILFLAGSSYVYDLLPEIKQQFPHLKIFDQLYNEYGHIENNRKYKQHIDLNIVENEAVEACLLKLQESKDRICLIHNGVSTTYFNPDSAKKLTFDMQLKRAIEHKFVISFIGRFSEEKSPELFIEIANKLKGDRGLHFVMAGDGALYETMSGLIDRYDLKLKVSLLGYVDTKTCLAASNLVILPSKIDGRPNAVLESLSMGIPVIASSVGGLPQIITNGSNGFLCQSGNAEDFVSRIQQIVADPTLYSQMRQAARDYAVNNLDISIAQAKYLEIFQKFMKIS